MVLDADSGSVSVSDVDGRPDDSVGSEDDDSEDEDFEDEDFEDEDSEGDDSEDGDSEDEDSDAGVSAHATPYPYPVTTAAPTARETAKPPTWSTNAAAFMDIAIRPGPPRTRGFGQSATAAGR